MPVPITAFYAGILGLLLTALAINVTVHRTRLHVQIGDGGNPQMQRMIRLHGNAAEYVPLGLILMGLCELDGGLHPALQAAGITLILSRVLHVWGMWNTVETTFGRVTGPTLTWLAIAAMAVLNLWQIR